MATPNQTSVDLPIQTFGGKVSQFDPQTLPIGASPFCQDCAFSGKNPSGTGTVAGVSTRPGTTPYYATPFAGNPTVNYLKTFVDSTTVFHLLSLDGLGNFRDESPCTTPPGVPAIIGNVVAASIAQSDSLISREWIAISDMSHPGFGIDVPRQWDAQFFDRVSQIGPGAPPTVKDISSPLTALSRASGVLSGTTSTPHELVPGGLVTINGMTADNTFNGSFPVATTPDALNFTAWGNPGRFTVNSITRVVGTVTAQLSAGGQNISPGDQIIVQIGDDNSFNGIYNAVMVDGNEITWAQAGPDAGTAGGILYTLAFSAPIAGVYPAINPPSGVGISEINIAENIANVPFVVGNSITIAGNGDASYNSTWIITAILQAPRLSNLPPYPNNTFIDFGSSIITSGLGGTATSFTPDASPTVSGVAGPGGNISPGLHQVSLSFVTREQYITKPAPIGFWNAAGGFKARVTNIAEATGLVNVVSRILMFTPAIVAPATSGSFFYFDGSVNTTTTGTFPNMVIPPLIFGGETYDVDFLDAVLLNATPANNLFNLLELGECAVAKSYSNRMFWAGERNKVPNFVNLTFDGGFANAPDGDIPLGWAAADPTGAHLNQITSWVWGSGLGITGDGVTDIIGVLSQSAYQDSLGVPIIQPKTPYSVRVRLKSNPVLTTGGFVVELIGGLSGLLYGSYVVTAAQVNAFPDGGEFIGQLTTGIAIPPEDLQIRIYAFTVNAFAGFLVDCIEVFPTQQPYNGPLVRASYANDPESFDQSTGYLIVGQATNQTVRTMFTLLDNKLYIVTERGLFSTQDDNQNEPSSWAINTVSDTVGTGSVHGVGVGESWAVIASHDGVYIFWGGEPVKISQEIQPDWDRINWAYDQTIYVVVDTANKRIHIGAPIDGATSPNVEFVCDYSQLANAEGSTAAQDISSHPQAYYSVYNPTKVVAPGKARKWTLWNLTANCATQAVLSDGSFHLLRGNGAGTGKVYDQSPTFLSDDGVAIDFQYQTAFFPQVEDEQALQLGSHRKLCKYLTGYAFGAGSLAFTMYGSQNQRAVSLTTLNLSNPAHWDWEMNVNFISERMSILIESNAVGSWAELVKLCPTIQRELITPVRGSM